MTLPIAESNLVIGAILLGVFGIVECFFGYRLFRLVLAVLGSANHDERRFANPETLDLARTPNPHLAFGQGVHYCLGAPLARLEGQIAFETLLRRFSDMQLAVPAESLPWRRGVFLRGVERLPLRVRSATRVVA